MRKIKTNTEEQLDKTQTAYNVRPANLTDYIGQEKIKENLKISIAAAKLRKAPLDHFLFSGPPGLGKTSLAMVIAGEMGAKIRTVNAPVIEKIKDMASILATLEDGDILFIDEIHRLPKNVEEMLYSAMEDRKIEIIIGEAEQSKVITMPLAAFTLIGATTREGLLSKPLLDRFPNKYSFDYYSDVELGRIAFMTATKYNTPVSEHVSLLIGKASRGTPRVAVNVTKRISDYMVANGIEQMTESAFYEVLSIIGISKEGFSEREIRYIDILRSTYEKTQKPVGLKTIAAFMGETTDTIEGTIEPYLLQKKLIARTASGRIPLLTENKKE